MTHTEKKAGNRKLHPDQSGDPASTSVHVDPRAGDVGASGALDRAALPKTSEPGHVDHGIDRILKEESGLAEDRAGDPADPEVHPDDAVTDVGAGGATHR